MAVMAEWQVRAMVEAERARIAEALVQLWDESESLTQSAATLSGADSQSGATVVAESASTSTSTSTSVGVGASASTSKLALIQLELEELEAAMEADQKRHESVLGQLGKLDQQQQQEAERQQQQQQQRRRASEAEEHSSTRGQGSEASRALALRLAEMEEQVTRLREEVSVRHAAQPSSPPPP